MLCVNMEGAQGQFRETLLRRQPPPMFTGWGFGEGFLHSSPVPVLDEGQCFATGVFLPSSKKSLEAKAGVMPLI